MMGKTRFFTFFRMIGQTDIKHEISVFVRSGVPHSKAFHFTNIFYFLALYLWLYVLYASI